MGISASSVMTLKVSEGRELKYFYIGERMLEQAVETGLNILFTSSDAHLEESAWAHFKSLLSPTEKKVKVRRSRDLGPQVQNLNDLEPYVKVTVEEGNNWMLGITIQTLMDNHDETPNYQCHKCEEPLTENYFTIQGNAFIGAERITSDEGWTDYCVDCMETMVDKYRHGFFEATDYNQAKYKLRLITAQRLHYVDEYAIYNCTPTVIDEDNIAVPSNTFVEKLPSAANEKYVEFDEPFFLLNGGLFFSYVHDSKGGIFGNGMEDTHQVYTLGLRELHTSIRRVKEGWSYEQAKAKHLDRYGDVPTKMYP